MAYIIKRESQFGDWDYFQDSNGDSPKWTRDRSKAGQFYAEREALESANPQNMYVVELEYLADNTSSPLEYLAE